MEWSVQADSAFAFQYLNFAFYKLRVSQFFLIALDRFARDARASHKKTADRPEHRLLGHTHRASLLNSDNKTHALGDFIRNSASTSHQANDDPGRFIFDPNNANQTLPRRSWSLYFAAVNRFLTRQEQLVLSVVLGLLLTGWAVKTYRLAHPPTVAAAQTETGNRE
jgi:hypothetical protein